MAERSMPFRAFFLQKQPDSASRDPEGRVTPARPLYSIPGLHGPMPNLLAASSYLMT
jgi:hypothetical protein